MPYTYKQPGNWKTIRRRILARDDNTCACGATATQVDHIIRPADGGTHEDHNLRAICTPCHDQRNKRQAQAGREHRNGKRKPAPHPGLLP